MPGNPTVEASDPVGFLLTLRGRSDQRVDLILRFYRGDELVRTTTAATVRPSVARLTLLACRLFLLERGLGEHAPRLPRAAGLDSVRHAA